MSTGAVVDQYLRVSPSDFSISDTPYTKDINPLSYFDGQTRSAGYVKLDHIQHAVANRDLILDLDISTVKENDHVWITFDGPSWNILRLNQNDILKIESVVKDSTVVTITFDKTHNYAAGDIVGFKDIPNLTGFYKIEESGFRYITVLVGLSDPDPEFDESTVSYIHEFTTARFSTYQDVDPRAVALLKYGSRLWIDANESDLWEVVEKTQQFTVKDIADYGTTAAEQTGYDIKYVEALKQTITSMPRLGFVMAYTESTSGLSLKQIVPPPTDFADKLNYSFGKSFDVSPDARFLVVGTPDASFITSTYRGPFNPSAEYFAGEIVLYAGKLWQAVNDIVGDGSSINLASENWTPSTLVESNPVGRGTGFTNQGMVTVYEWKDQQWTQLDTILSPRQENYEYFGSSISIGVSGTKYYMAVSATGSQDNRGRVYLYIYENGAWRHLEDTSYVGLYTTGETYPAGSIVWSAGALWQAVEETLAVDDEILVDNLSWTSIDPVSTVSSLPRNVSVDDDGSTLATGMLSSSELSELTKMEISSVLLQQ